MTNKQPVYSMSISGKLILEMHSLNNEGGEGNQISTRIVTLVYRDKESGEYKFSPVNAISGDMIKHIQTEHLYLLSKGSLPLCKGCQKFSASRVLDDGNFMASLAKKDSDVIDDLLKHCVIDDLAGNLIAKGNRAIPRKSIAEYGWVVGIPEYTQTESYFHVRFASEHGDEQTESEKQAIFHRPASSGVYAIVANFEVARIGLNDISQKYAISDDERIKRYSAFLESILYTFIRPSGAMRGTQNPHIVGFDGVITTTSQVMPAPALSPLDENYRQELERVTMALNSLKPKAMTIQPFESIGHFTETMKNLMETTVPFKLMF